MRCVNCQLRIDQLQRHRLSDESDQVVKRVQRWISPREVTRDDYTCHSCWELITNPNVDPELKPRQQLGHRNVCVGCGRSILRIKSRPVLKSEMSDREIQIGNIVSQWIRPRKLTNIDEVCVPCYLRAKRKFESSHRSAAPVAPSTSLELTQPLLQPKIEQVEDDIMPTSEYSLNGTSTEQILVKTEAVDTSEIEEEPAPSISTPLLQVTSAQQILVKTEAGDTREIEAHESSISTTLLQTKEADIRQIEEEPSASISAPSLGVTSAEKITLPTLRRAADTSNHCLFLKCNNSKKRCVPDSVRKHILKNFNFYIPKNARICDFHLGANLFYELYANENTISTFSAAHIEEIVYLLADDSKLDFQNHESIDDHLFEYWFGRTKAEFNDILLKVPRLNSIKMKVGLSAYFCKMRTGDTDERMSALFQIPRRTLEGYMKQARKILQLSISQESIKNVSSTS